MAKRATTASLEVFDTLPDSALVDCFLLAMLLACSVGTVWRRARTGVLPAPVRVSPQQTRWRVGDVRKYLASIDSSCQRAA